MESRREFLKGTAWMAGAAMAVGCTMNKVSLGGQGVMSNFAVAPMEKIRVGFLGLGERGHYALSRVTGIPGIEATALCDLRPERVSLSKKTLKEKNRIFNGRVYEGTEEIWKGLCDDDNVDVVYICTPAALHAEMEIYALNAGKHVLVEVPGARTNEDAWAIVEACEKARRHCMMLENCCYGENELLAWNLAHKGLLGTLTHAEGGYIHNLCWRRQENHFRNRRWFDGGKVHHDYGNTYPTHALGPICMQMDINRGDRMERIVSMSSNPAAMREYAAVKYKPEEWQNRTEWMTGDMNTSIVKTAKGRTIMMQSDMATPRPYSRINLLQGSKGCFYDYPPRLALAEIPGAEAKWLAEKDYQIARRDHRHPLWKAVGELAKKKGGHGGMDFIMDLRWAWCLQNGLPLDMDVYDLASWSSIVPCSAESDMKGGMPVELPDFTRGAWKTTKPIAVGGVDLKKMGFEV